MLQTCHSLDPNKLKLPKQLGLREISKDDQPFLDALFLSARPHLQLINLPEPLLTALISQQCMLQQNHYQSEWPNAEKRIITQARTDIGKIFVAANNTSLHIIDLILLSAYRNKGIGRSLLNSLQQVAKQENLSLKLSVDKQNGLAKKLYLSMGFQVTSQTETHDSMIWVSRH